MKRRLLLVSLMILLVLILTPLVYAADLIDSYTTGPSWYSMRRTHTSPVSYRQCCAGQSFNVTVGDKKITIASFHLQKVGSPTGNARAVVYNYTGTFGSSSIPDTALAYSDTIDVSTISTTMTWYNLSFSGAEQITLSNETVYFIVYENPSSGTIDDSNYIRVGADTSGTHEGNLADHDSAGWSAVSGSDAKFYVYGEDVAVDQEYSYDFVEYGNCTSQVVEGKEKAYLTSQTGEASSSLVWGKELLTLFSESGGSSSQLNVFQEKLFGPSQTLLLSTTVVYAGEIAEYIGEVLELTTATSQPYLGVEKIFFPVETAVAEAVMSFALETAEVFFILTETLVSTAVITTTYEVVTLTLANIAGLAALAFILALAALSLALLSKRL